jgi:hypothetical protein
MKEQNEGVISILMQLANTNFRQTHIVTCYFEEINYIVTYFTYIIIIMFRKD